MLIDLLLVSGMRLPHTQIQAQKRSRHTHLDWEFPFADDLFLLPAPVHVAQPCAPGNSLGVVEPEAECPGE